MKKRSRSGFTLIELLVVAAVIAILFALSLPAISAVREAARKTTCLNHFRQIGFALNNYVSVAGRYPPSFEIERGTVLSKNNGSWSIHGRLLPFIDQNGAYYRIDLDTAWDAQRSSGVPTMRVDAYVCPSELNDTVRIDTKTGKDKVYPQTIGFNMGTWCIYDPVEGKPGSGPFFVNSRVRPLEVVDGISNTLAAAEVKAFTSYIRNTPDPGSTPPSSADAFLGYTGQRKLGSNLHKNTGHTEWPDGRVHHSGFTTVFTPNTVVPYEYQGETYDIDFNSVQEGKQSDQTTYAAVTSRSYHPGSVNILRLDGSVTSISNNIDLRVWRAISTINGYELFDNTQF